MRGISICWVNSMTLIHFMYLKKFPKLLTYSNHIPSRLSSDHITDYIEFWYFCTEMIKTLIQETNFEIKVVFKKLLFEYESFVCLTSRNFQSSCWAD